MTINSEQIQALKAKAVDRIIAEIKAKHSHYDAYAPVMTWGEFCTIVTERDADKALIAELKEHINSLEEGVSMLLAQYDQLAAAIGWTTEKALAGEGNQGQYAESMVKRIAELEAALNLASASYAGERERADALQARTLTVKLPESVIDAICLTAAEIHNLGRGVSDERAQEIINSIRCAAGITLVVEE